MTRRSDFELLELRATCKTKGEELTRISATDVLALIDEVLEARRGPMVNPAKFMTAAATGNTVLEEMNLGRALRDLPPLAADPLAPDPVGKLIFETVVQLWRAESDGEFSPADADGFRCMSFRVSGCILILDMVTTCGSNWLFMVRRDTGPEASLRGSDVAQRHGTPEEIARLAVEALRARMLAT